MLGRRGGGLGAWIVKMRSAAASVPSAALRPGGRCSRLPHSVVEAKTVFVSPTVGGGDAAELMLGRRGGGLGAWIVKMRSAAESAPSAALRPGGRCSRLPHSVVEAKTVFVSPTVGGGDAAELMLGRRGGGLGAWIVKMRSAAKAAPSAALRPGGRCSRLPHSVVEAKTVFVSPTVGGGDAAELMLGRRGGGLGARTRR